MLSSRWRRTLKFWEMSIILALLAAVLAIAVAMFLQSFYARRPLEFEPKDTQRGLHLERQAPQQGHR